MSDQFVDDLFARLHAERSETLTRAASATQSRERVVAAACVWWDDFCQAIERKAQAWNAKDATDAHVTCTRNASGSIVLWHRSIETELRLAEARVGDDGPDRRHKAARVAVHPVQRGARVGRGQSCRLTAL
jgi:hypothetical protein